jgi:hypothetical protein
MSLKDVDAAQAHREMYIAIIKSVLRTYGDQKALAEKLGIQPEHLSSMLSAGLDRFEINPEAFIRTPGRKVAEQIIELLPTDSEIRQSLLWHFQMVWQGQHATLLPLSSRLWLLQDTIVDLLNEIGQAHLAANRTPDLQVARHNYRVIERACKLIVRRIDPNPDLVDDKDPDLNGHPLEFIQVCLFLHDVQCVLNRAHDALAHAKYAYYLMAACDEDRFRHRIEYFDHLMVNTAVAECLAYRNMGLVKEAQWASEKAEWLIEQSRSSAGEFWRPHIYLHRLKALIEMPRFTIGEIDQLVRQAAEAFDVTSGGSMESHRLQMVEAQARAYLQYGVHYNSRLRLREAERLLRQIVEQIDEHSLGVVHKTRILRTYASIEWGLGELDAWNRYVELGLQTALSAGLIHQLAQAEQEYGSAVLPILYKLKQTKHT